MRLRATDDDLRRKLNNGRSGNGRAKLPLRTMQTCDLESGFVDRLTDRFVDRPTH